MARAAARAGLDLAEMDDAIAADVAGYEAIIEENQIAQRAGRPLGRRSPDGLRGRTLLRPGPLRHAEVAPSATGADGAGRVVPCESATLHIDIRCECSAYVRHVGPGPSPGCQHAKTSRTAILERLIVFARTVMGPLSEECELQGAWSRLSRWVRLAIALQSRIRHGAFEEPRKPRAPRPERLIEYEYDDEDDAFDDLDDDEFDDDGKLYAPGKPNTVKVRTSTAPSARSSPSSARASV